MKRASLSCSFMKLQDKDAFLNVRMTAGFLVIYIPRTLLIPLISIKMKIILHKRCTGYEEVVASENRCEVEKGELDIFARRTKCCRSGTGDEGISR